MNLWNGAPRFFHDVVEIVWRCEQYIIGKSWSSCAVVVKELKSFANICTTWLLDSGFSQVLSLLLVRTYRLKMLPDLAVMCKSQPRLEMWRDCGTNIFQIWSFNATERAVREATLNKLLFNFWGDVVERYTGHCGSHNHNLAWRFVILSYSFWRITQFFISISVTFWRQHGNPKSFIACWERRLCRWS